MWVGTAKTAIQITRVADEVLGEDAEIPHELFHYTDTSGLIGILGGKGELWATDTRCLNDTGELKLGLELLDQAIQAQAEHPSGSLLARLLKHPAYVSGAIFTT